MGLPGCDVVLHDHMCTSPAQLRRVHAADPAFGLGRFGVVVVASHGGEHRARATMAAHGPTRRCGTRSPAGRRHPRGARRVVSLVDSGEGSPFSLPVPGRPPGGSYGTTVRRGAAVTRGARSGNTACRSRFRFRNGARSDFDVTHRVQLVGRAVRPRCISTIAICQSSRLRGSGGPPGRTPRARRRRRPSSNYATRSLFEQAGFTYIRSKGLHHSVMRKTVHSTRATRTRTRAKR